MKHKILILLILLSHYGLARALEENYQITLKSDKNKSFSLYNIKKNGEEVASFCVIDPGKVFKFFSIDDDPDFFSCDLKNYTENHIDSLSQEKRFGPPSCVILADLKKTGLSINFSYFWESLGILFAADSHIKKAGIISSEKLNNRYFLEAIINNKNMYCLLVLKESCDKKTAYKLIKTIKEFGSINFKLIPIIDFPLKLISYDSRKTVIYESKKGHAKYSCLFISSKRLPR